MVRLTAAFLILSGCSTPPEQPDLNTYGAIQPLCLFICRQIFTLTEGDTTAEGGTPVTVGALSSTVSNSETENNGPN